MKINLENPISKIFFFQGAEKVGEPRRDIRLPPEEDCGLQGGQSRGGPAQETASLPTEDRESPNRHQPGIVRQAGQGKRPPTHAVLLGTCVLVSRGSPAAAAAATEQPQRFRLGTRPGPGPKSEPGKVHLQS